MCSRSFRVVLASRCFCCCRRRKLRSANRSAGPADGGGDDELRVVHGRRYLMVRRRDLPQRMSSSSRDRAHVTNEPLLVSAAARRPADELVLVECAADNSNRRDLQPITTDTNVPGSSSQPYD